MAAASNPILAVLRQNVVSIVAGVVAAAAVVVPFVVASPMVAEAEQSLARSAGLSRDVQSLLDRPRRLPNLVPGATETRPLEVFPTRAVIAAGEAAVGHLRTQAEVMRAAALQLNTYRGLVPEVFTAPDGSQYAAAALRFRDAYNRVVPAGLNERVGGGMPPTPEEVAARVEAARQLIARERSVMQGTTVINAPEVAELQARAAAEVPLAMRAEAARRFSVYVSPDTWTSAAATMAATRAPPRDTVWMAQLGLWIQEDVASIIRAANGQSTSVLTSPVKHLVRVTFAENPYILPAPQGGGDFGGPAALPVTGVNPGGAVTLNRAQSLTGRVSNSVYDVVHYQMVVRVRESDVPRFLAQIPQGRLHYVLSVDMRSVDSVREAVLGFLYGNDPVVELTIDVEALFLREWTQQWMPRGVQERVGMREPRAVEMPQ